MPPIVLEELSREKCIHKMFSFRAMTVLHVNNCHRYFVVQIDSCEVEPFEGLSVVQAQISKLTVHQSVHLLKVKKYI